MFDALTYTLTLHTSQYMWSPNPKICEGNDAKRFPKKAGKVTPSAGQVEHS